MKKLKYKISISGSGTPEKIAKELREIADSLEMEGRKKPNEAMLDGVEWEGPALITTIDAK